jgi:hypothetical protein
VREREEREGKADPRKIDIKDDSRRRRRKKD